MIQVRWTNTATERVWWDIEVTDQNGRVVLSQTGVGRGDQGRGLPAENNFLVGENVTRCFRVRARTARGTQGCVSQIWSARVCASTGDRAPPAFGGPWAALAANGKGNWGFALGVMDQAGARNAAMRGCGAADCKIEIAAQARCFAYFESRRGGYWYGLSLDQTLARVIEVARGGCQRGAPAGSCRQVRAQCR
jgi:hypothetical protein